MNVNFSSLVSTAWRKWDIYTEFCRTTRLKEKTQKAWIETEEVRKKEMMEKHY